MSVAQRMKDLESYRPALTRQADFERFWEHTLGQAKAQPLRESGVETPHPIKAMRVMDIQYCGFDETPVHGYFLRPAQVPRGEKIPCMIQFHGYGGNRGKPFQLLPWVMLGMAVLSVECREQGGQTGNLVPTQGAVLGNISTKGLLDESQYYYRAVYMDCVKAIDFALLWPQIDPSRIFLRGVSQGGGLAVATAALDPRPAAVIAHVPSQSNLQRRVEGSHGSYASIHEYLRYYPRHMERAYQTLSYFDTMNMAERIACPVYASVALEDDVCPAECFYATYNRLPCLKQIQHYPFSGHTDALPLQVEAELEWLWAILHSNDKEMR